MVTMSDDDVHEDSPGAHQTFTWPYLAGDPMNEP